MQQLNLQCKGKTYSNDKLLSARCFLGKNLVPLSQDFAYLHMPLDKENRNLIQMYLYRKEHH